MAAELAWRWSATLEDLMSAKHGLAPMQWELDLASTINVSHSQIRFILAYFTHALVIGPGIRLLRSPTLRHLYATVTGIALLYYTYGAGLLQSVIPIVFTYSAMILAPKKCGVITWSTVFPFLIWVHVINASGMAWKEGALDFSGSCMMLVLKLIALAVCHQDARGRRPEDLSEGQRALAVHHRPSPLELLSYLFGLGNPLGGPHIEYHVWDEFINLQGVWDPSRRQASPLRPAALQLTQALGAMALYQYGMAVWGFDGYVMITTREVYMRQPVYIRWVMASLCNYVYEQRYFFAWKLSELNCTLAGINFAGWDEKTGKAVWGRLRNVDIKNMMLADSGRNIPLAWNIQTGNWLRRYVYERAVRKGQKPGLPQLLITQTTSAIWHGLYPGYLLFFVTSVFFIQGSTTIYKAEQTLLPQALVRSLPWKLLKIFYTQITCANIVMPLHVLEGHKGLAIWRSTGFISHILIFSIFALGFVLPKPKRSKAAAASNGKAQAGGKGDKKED